MGDIDDKRGGQRRRVLREAKIVFNAGSSLIDCYIRDQHEDGAKLRVPAPTVLPDTFEVLFVAEERMCAAEIAWRRGDELGVRFIGPPRPAPPLHR